MSFTNASVIDLKLRLHEYCRRHHQEGIEHVSITTLHSLALRLLRQAGLLETYPTRPLVLDDWELENIYDAEFGDAEGINSRPRREKIRRFYEALWSTGVPNAPTYVPPDPPIGDEERQHFEVFHQPTARVYSAVLPGEIVRNCVQATVSGLMDPAQLRGIRHLVVDEYQDLNPADLEFVDQLATAGVTIRSEVQEQADELERERARRRSGAPREAPLVDGAPLEDRIDGGGWREFLASRPVHAGDVLYLLTSLGWHAVRYESNVPQKRAFLYLSLPGVRDEVVVPVPREARFAWPQELKWSVGPRP